jgi:anti-sigma28 factor (negative regulator of flagellin synthesis)
MSENFGQDFEQNLEQNLEQNQEQNRIRKVKEKMAQLKRVEKLQKEINNLTTKISQKKEALSKLLDELNL